MNKTEQKSGIQLQWSVPVLCSHTTLTIIVVVVIIIIIITQRHVQKSLQHSPVRAVLLWISTVQA